MEIVLNVSEVLPRIATVAGIIGNKNVIPILDNLRFTARNDGSMDVMGSNSETWVTSPLPVVSANIDGADEVCFCIETNLLLQAMKNLGNKELSMVFNPKDGIVTCGYNTGVFKMPYGSADEYPMPVDVVGSDISINAVSLCYAIAKTKNATANDTLRPQLNGIHFDFVGNAMKCVATDSHRLALYTDNTVQTSGEQIEMTLPVSALQIVADCASKCNDDVVLTVSGVNAKFSFPDGRVVVTRKVEGRYPNYESVIPKDGTDIAYIIKQETIEALRHVIPMGSESTNLVVLDFDSSKKQTFNVMAEDLDFSRSAQEEVRCVEYNGSTMIIGFNGNFLTQALSCFDCEQVRIIMNGATRGALIVPADKDASLVYLIMPTLVS